jgi:integral membrane protein
MNLASILRFDTPTARLRAMAFVEGISYLVLLFGAMPLKYLADFPLPVRVVGSIHGFLFVCLALLSLQGMLSRGKSFGWGVRIGGLSLVPFGTFFLDGALGQDDETWRAQQDSAH